MSNVLFISVNDIKLRTGLTANVEEKLVLPEIYTAQDMYILPALGTALYNRLLAGIVASNLTSTEQALIDTYITPSLVFYVMAELPMGLSYQFYNKGVIRKADNNATEPSAQELIEVANKYRGRAEFYKERLVRYLKEESGRNTFPEYNNPGNRYDTIIPDRDAYRTTVWLGDTDRCCEGMTLAEKFQGNINYCCGEGK
jgi:hypothetical protein